MFVSLLLDVTYLVALIVVRPSMILAFATTRFENNTLLVKNDPFSKNAPCPGVTVG